MKRSLCVLATFSLLVGCVWEPPGGGEAKGCLQDVSYADPLTERFGISSHLEWGAGPTADAYRDFEIGKWDELGLRAIRRDLQWNAIEPSRGEFDFTRPDRVVDATEAAGVDLLAILDYGNWWASSSGDSTAPPDDVVDFGNYAAAVAERYAGRVRHYEVWNEQNVGINFWHPTEDPVGYAELLVEASARVRQADPEALVSFGGVFGPSLLLNTDGETFIRQVAEVLPDFGDHVDLMAFHPYRYPFTAPEFTEADGQRSLATEICDMHSLVAELGAADLPLWITELGWHTAMNSFAPGVEPEVQAAYLVRSALISFAQGVERYYWYTFRDSGTATDDQEQRFGLYTFDPDPSSEPEASPVSADELETLLTVLGTHRRVRDRSEELGLDDQTWAVELSGGTGTTLALWTAGEPQHLRVPRSGVGNLVGPRGEEIDLVSQGGAWEIEVSGSPVYLISE
ncbi:MAG: hypothetical protein VX498_04445 [Myxococcota bacterium]|nr:hypothetical protein [Myxococcota bacterium]